MKRNELSSMMIHWYDPSVRLTGRWARNLNAVHDPHLFIQRCPDCATTSAPGSYFELAFTGHSALLKFDLGYLGQPFPHLWISVDGGARVEAPVDRYLRIEAQGGGAHVVQVIYKGGTEQLSRWYELLAGAISFIGAEADVPPNPCIPCAAGTASLQTASRRFWKRSSADNIPFELRRKFP